MVYTASELNLKLCQENVTWGMSSDTKFISILNEMYSILWISSRLIRQVSVLKIIIDYSTIKNHLGSIDYQGVGIIKVYSELYKLC